MRFFGWIFWMAMFWFALTAWRRWHRWRVVGPGWYGAHRRRWDSGEWSGPRRRDPAAREPRAQSDEQQPYIDALETRVSELEERLDFTERLLAGRGESPSLSS